MTDREKAIVQAYTGIVMLTGEKFNVFYEYLSKLYGRPVYTHEIPMLNMKEKAKPDFIKLCEATQPTSPCALCIYSPPRPCTVCEDCPAKGRET